MSTVKINTVQVGQSGTASQNFTLTAAQADGTIKLSRGNAGVTTQDVLSVAADGRVDFPAGLSAFLGSNQSLTENGYQKLPGGLTVQWGKVSYLGTDGAAGKLVNFNIAFPNACLAIVSSDSGSGVNSTASTPVSTTQFRVWGRYNDGAYATTDIRWIALGY